MYSPKSLDFSLYQRENDHPDWKAIHELAVERAREIIPLIHKDCDDTIIDHTADRLRVVKSLATFANNFRINKKRWQEGNHALRPLYFIWTMLYKCNFRCAYCDDHRGNHYYDLEDHPLGFADRMRVLQTMRTGTSAIYFCGGEPTMVPELPHFTDACFHMGYRPLMINTNGFLIYQNLKKPAYRKWLRQMDIIIVSLDGLSVPGMQKLWGAPKVEEVFTNLLMLRELRQVVDFKLVVNTVISPETIKMASDVLDFANDLDIWFVPVPVNYHGKDAEGFAFERDVVTRDDYKELAERILRRKEQGRRIIGSRRILDMLLNVRPYHCLPTLRPHVDPDGRVAWPCRAPKHIEPAFVNLLDHPDLDSAWKDVQARMSATNFHGQGPTQCGDNCAWMQNYTTARYHDFLTDPLHAGMFSEIRDFAFRT